MKQRDNGIEWCSKRERKKRTGSRMPGSAEGPNCQATALCRYFAKKSRSYKHPEYHKWPKWEQP